MLAFDGIGVSLHFQQQTQSQKHHSSSTPLTHPKISIENQKNPNPLQNPHPTPTLPKKNSTTHFGIHPINPTKQPHSTHTKITQINPKLTQTNLYPIPKSHIKPNSKSNIHQNYKNQSKTNKPKSQSSHHNLKTQ